MIKYSIKRTFMLILTFLLIFTLIYILLSMANYKVWYRGFTNWEFFELAWADYKVFFMNVVRDWDFGSFTNMQSYFDRVMEELPLTFQINFTAFFIYIFFGLLLGMITAYYHGSLIDKIISNITIVFASVPGYVTMLFLMLYLGYKWGWFPGRFDYYADDPVSTFQAWFLPIVALSLGPISRIMRILRGDLVEAMNEDYLLLCKMKGLNKFQMMFRHGLRNSVLPVITEIPRLFALTLSMSFIIEITYNLRGAAYLLNESVITPSMDGNYLSIHVPIATLICSFYVIMVLIVSFFSDLSYAIIDPRIQMGSKKSSYKTT